MVSSSASLELTVGAYLSAERHAVTALRHSVRVGGQDGSGTAGNYVDRRPLERPKSAHRRLANWASPTPLANRNRKLRLGGGPFFKVEEDPNEKHS